MNPQAKRRELGAHARRVIALPALVVAASLASTAAASAQTTPFRASVTATGVRGGGIVPLGGCSNGAFFCGTANIAGYGVASWNFGNVTNPTISDTPCGTSYTATTEFTLLSDPRSTLVLDESGNLCGLGHDGAAYRGYFAEGPQAYGHPFVVVGNWTIDRADSTGQFAGLSGGSGTGGTDALHVAGAHAAGSYSGTLG